MTETPHHSAFIVLCGQGRIRTTEGDSQLISSQLRLSPPAYAVCGLDFVFIRSGCFPSSLYTVPTGTGSALPSPRGFTEFGKFSSADSSAALQESPVLLRRYVHDCTGDSQVAFLLVFHKANSTPLQSAPFGRLGTCPYTDFKGSTLLRWTDQCRQPGADGRT